jgi:Cft2 family RNA processing exonuclease
LDYLDIFGKEGGHPPYDQKDVREAVLHTIPVKYGVVTDVAPDMKLTLHNEGHIIGSSIVHLHIGEGLHNVVYSVDWDSPISLIDPEGLVRIKKIGELIDTLMLKEEPSGEFVERIPNIHGWKTFAFDPTTYEAKVVPITSVTRHPISEALYEVRTATGRKVTVTGSHSIFVAKDGRITSAKVRDLRKGDYIIGAREIPRFNLAKQVVTLDEREFHIFWNDRAELRSILIRHDENIASKFPAKRREIMRWVREHYERGAYRSEIARKYHAKSSRVRGIFKELGIVDSPRLKAKLPKHFRMTPEFARFLGYFASEGNTTGNTVVVSNYLKDIRKQCVNTIQPFFDCAIFEDEREVRFASRSLRKLLDVLGALGTAHTKRVSPLILGGSETNACEFLRGYFAGDGTLRIRSKGCSISAGSKSEMLMQDVAFLLLRIGIPVTFEYNRTNRMHLINVYGMDNIVHFLEKVKIDQWSRALIAVNPRMSKNAFWDRAPLVALSPDLQARLHKTAYKYAKSIGRGHLESLLEFGQANDALIAHSPFIYDEVKSIRSVEPNRRHVYDLSVDGYENFLGGSGFLFLHNTGDFKFGRTMLLEPATCSFPRAESLIMESTYGGPDDVMSDRETVEGRLAKIVNETAERGGRVLIPTLAVGRAQEIMLVLNAYMKNKQIKELPIFIEGMISEATAIHTAYPEYLARDLREQILYKDINPFQSDYFTNVDHPSEREKIATGPPCIILATSGMMEGGPAIDYFRYMAADEKNTLVFVSYQVEGTLGNRLKNGAREVSLMGRNGKVEALKVNLHVDSVEGFSGHSDRNQLFAFLKRVSPRPSRVIMGHGERRKTDLFAHQVSRILKLRTIAPDILETLRLR